MRQEYSKDKIYQYIKQKRQTTVDNIRRDLGYSRSLIHRRLNMLVEVGDITKVGKSPRVFYVCDDSFKNRFEEYPELSAKDKNFLDKNYLYISPVGEMISGIEGFSTWVRDIKQEKYLKSLVHEYVTARKHANQFINNFGYINATKKLQNVFGEISLEKVFYADFYSLPKFGKTRLGQLVLYSKQAQNIKLIKDVGKQVAPIINKIVEDCKIEALGFIPPTIPRNVQFQKEFEKLIHLPSSLSHIDFVKAYVGSIPVAQKTLSKVEERVENAKRTIFIKDTNLRFSNVLLIDDAIGSGATLNETAKKLIERGMAEKVFGFAVVGSYKGFDVIREV